MSWWVSLRDAVTDEVLTVEPFEDGGTYMLGGSDEADLNITYNYSKHYHAQLDAEEGLNWLHGKRGAETQERLATAVAALGVTPDADYWKSTPGNAGRALERLRQWACQHPDGVFHVN